LKFSFHLDLEEFENYWDTDAFIKKSDVKWSTNGITFATASGHRVFIPKTMFIGGR
jgi:hypothetical protein